MKNFKILMLISALSLMAFASCKKEDVEQVTNSEEVNTSVQIESLEEITILGKWQLESRSENGISSLAVECCDYIEFTTGDQAADLEGEFYAYGLGYETNGIFELNNTATTIQLVYDNTQRLYDLQISGNSMQFSYSENNKNIVENWKKQQ